MPQGGYSACATEDSKRSRDLRFWRLLRPVPTSAVSSREPFKCASSLVPYSVPSQSGRRVCCHDCCHTQHRSSVTLVTSFSCPAVMRRFLKCGAPSSLPVLSCRLCAFRSLPIFKGLGFTGALWGRGRASGPQRGPQHSVSPLGRAVETSCSSRAQRWLPMRRPYPALPPGQVGRVGSARAPGCPPHRRLAKV
jgi:hypothetical protein